MDIRQELLEFHRRQYTANLMRLVVFGKGSLDELQGMVVDKFSSVSYCRCRSAPPRRRCCCSYTEWSRLGILLVLDVLLLTLFLLCSTFFVELRSIFLVTVKRDIVKFRALNRQPQKAPPVRSQSTRCRRGCNQHELLCWA